MSAAWPLAHTRSNSILDIDIKNQIFQFIVFSSSDFVHSRINFIGMYSYCNIAGFCIHSQRSEIVEAKIIERIFIQNENHLTETIKTIEDSVYFANYHNKITRKSV